MLFIKFVATCCLTFFAGTILSGVACAASSQPDSVTKDPIDYKLTLSHYATKEVHANDINLRASLGNQTGWIGAYKEGPSEFSQIRVGYERTDKLLLAKVVTSLQAANHGFLGFAVTAEVGGPFYGIVGFGRTNLRPYANLNFDPNDAITLGLGWRKADGPSVSLFVVRDDRVMPGQQIVHFVVKSPLPNGDRITLDLFNKSGSNDDQGLPINGTGAAATYDWPRYFARLAYDPKVNFTQENMTRLSIGIRF
jgi:hypothetical protein